MIGMISVVDSSPSLAGLIPNGKFVSNGLINLTGASANMVLTKTLTM